MITLCRKHLGKVAVCPRELRNKAGLILERACILGEAK